MAKSVVRRAARGLAKVSVEEIDREIARRRKAASRLEVKRDRLLSKLADLEREIRECGGGALSVAAYGSPRAGRTSTLQKALAELLKGRTMSVTEMAQAVQKAGYRTDSPNFRTIVNAALIKHTSLFRRVGRGQYTAR